MSLIDHLNPEQKQYLNKRRSELRWWPWMAAAACLGLSLLALLTFQNARELVDPNYMRQLLNNNLMDMASVQRYAVLGTMAWLCTGVLVLVLVLTTFIALANEKRLLDIIDALTTPAPAPTAVATPATPASAADTQPAEAD